jgi:hypothetical protein
MQEELFFIRRIRGNTLARPAGLDEDLDEFEPGEVGLIAIKPIDRKSAETVKAELEALGVTIELDPGWQR